MPDDNSNYNPDLPAYLNMTADPILARDFFAVVGPEWSVAESVAVHRHQRNAIERDITQGVAELVTVAHPRQVRPTTPRYLANRSAWRPFGLRNIRGDQP